MIKIILFDEMGEYEISLPTDDSSDPDLDDASMLEYERAIASIATRFLDIQCDPNNQLIGTQC